MNAKWTLSKTIRKGEVVKTVYANGYADVTTDEDYEEGYSTGVVISGINSVDIDECIVDILTPDETDYIEENADYDDNEIADLVRDYAEFELV